MSVGVVITSTMAPLRHTVIGNGRPMASSNNRRCRLCASTTGTRPAAAAGGVAGPSGLGAGSLSSRVSTSWSTPEPTPKKVPVKIPDYKVGNVVFHPKFGEGQITEVANRRDGDLELAVLFKKKDHGQKRLIASLANMDIIS